MRRHARPKWAKENCENVKCETSTYIYTPYSYSYKINVYNKDTTSSVKITFNILLASAGVFVSFTSFHFIGITFFGAKSMLNLMENGHGCLFLFCLFLVCLTRAIIAKFGLHWGVKRREKEGRKAGKRESVWQLSRCGQCVVCQLHNLKWIHLMWFYHCCCHFC